MKNIELTKMEQENLDYLLKVSSGEHVRRSQINKIKQDLKKMKFNSVLKAFKRKYQKTKIQTMNNLEIPDIDSNIGDSDLSNKKIAIYTAIFGGYDELADPIFYDPSIDYIAFTDRDIKSKIWSVIKIDSKFSGTDSNRLYKFSPHKFLDSYDYSIYIDGNVQIYGDVKPLIANVSKNSGLAFHRNGERDCIYQEAAFCKIIGKGNTALITKTISQYEKEGFPKHFGMCGCNIIISDLKNDLSKSILTQWLEEFNRSQMGRDQIIFPYIVWKNGLGIKDIGFLGEFTNLNPKFRVNNHSEEDKVNE